MRLEHYIEYLIPGSLYPEEYPQRVDSRDLQTAIKNMPKHTFCFTFYDVEIREGVLEDGTKIEDKKTVNKSKRFYPGGILMTREDVAREVPDSSILQNNMRYNGWDFVVKTRMGNFQPVEEGDLII